MRKSSEILEFSSMARLHSGLALRANTFRKMFEYLDRLDTPINIIETGLCSDQR